jgi:hypothetical protein
VVPRAGREPLDQRVEQVEAAVDVSDHEGAHRRIVSGAPRG